MASRTRSRNELDTDDPAEESAAASAPARRSWQTVLVVVFAGIFLAGWGAAWIIVRDRVSQQEEYYLRAEQVDLTPLPPWIRSDVKSEVLRDASLDRPLSVLDDDLARRIYEAFPLHPWIARVERVSKRYPARVVVDVVYRRPICMVEVSGGVHPADIDSIVLPSGDFSAVDAARFPLLRGIDTQPGPVGTPWGDLRVQGGCRLAAALADVWMELQLASLAPLPQAEDSPDEPILYELLTRAGQRIVWGLAPGEADQSLSAAKIARLRQCLAEAAARDQPPRTIHLEGLDGVAAPAAAPTAIPR